MSVRGVRMWLASLLLCSPVVAPAAGEKPQTGQKPQTFEAVRFGVRIQVQLYASDGAVAKNAATAAFEEVRRLDGVFSDYSPQSEARQLAAAAPDSVTISQPLRDVLAYSEQARRVTRGAFDVRVGPLTHLWRKSRRFKRLPELEKLSAAQSEAVNTAIELSPSRVVTVPGGRAKIVGESARLDFGGVAKGFAIDRVADVLNSRGVTAYLIDFGGDIRVGGERPGGQPWTIEVEATAGETDRLSIADGAIATSGDTYQHVILEGRRLSHIIDPRSGEPLESHPQVTVYAETATAADTLASALCVMGADEGFSWLNDCRDDIANIFGPTVAVRFDDEGTVTTNSEWRRRFGNEPAAR